MKQDYVRKSTQTREHTCHWPGCDEQVKPAMWGCSKHWLLLPYKLRRKLWDVFEPGQEVFMNPSDEYIEVAKEIQEWIKANYGHIS